MVRALLETVFILGVAAQHDGKVDELDRLIGALEPFEGLPLDPMHGLGRFLQQAAGAHDGPPVITSAVLHQLRIARMQQASVSYSPEQHEWVRDALEILHGDPETRTMAQAVDEGRVPLRLVPARYLAVKAEANCLRKGEVYLAVERASSPAELAATLVHEIYHAQDPRFGDAEMEARAYRAELSWRARRGLEIPEFFTYDQIRNFSDSQFQRLLDHRLSPTHPDAAAHNRLRPTHSVRTRAIQEVGALGTFAASFLLKEALTAAETGDAGRMRQAGRQLGQADFWLSLGAFTAAARAVEVAGGLWKFPRLLRATAPLTVGMLAVQLLSGQVSGSHLATATIAYSLSGLVAGLVLRTPTGRAARIAHGTLTLYLGEKLETWLRAVCEAPSRAAAGVIDQVREIAP